MGTRDQTRRPGGHRWVAAVAAAAVLVLVWPAVQAHVKAIGVLGETLDLPVPRPFAPAVTRERATVGGVAGELYSPGRPAPAVLLVPGATPAGLGDSRAIAVATAYARAGRTVFVPELELYEQRFDEADLEALVDAARGLARRHGTAGEVVMVGFSYGGSFALLAAADRQLDGLVRHVGVFGAYHDLVGVVQAVTTGVSLVDGDAVPWTPHPLAEDIMREHAVELAPSEQRPLLRQALAGGVAVAELPAESRAIHRLLDNEDPARTFALAERLPTDARDRLARFSPATVTHRVGVPVSVLHSTDDLAVPYGEALRIERSVPNARLHTVTLFTHVDFEPGGTRLSPGALGDLWRTWRFTSRLLWAQERRLP